MLLAYMNIITLSIDSIILRVFHFRFSAVAFRLHRCLYFTVCICIFMRDFSGSVRPFESVCGSESESGSDSVTATPSVHH